MANAFTPNKVKWEGNKSGSKDYIQRKIYLEFVQTGTDENGKAIGSIQPIVKETKVSIRGLIDSHKDETGLQNIIKKYLLTGDTNLFNQNTPLPNGDYTQTFDSPENIMAKIPDELKKGRSVEDFLKNFSKDELVAFAEALKEKVKEKPDNEEKE